MPRQAKYGLLCAVDDRQREKKINSRDDSRCIFSTAQDAKTEILGSRMLLAVGLRRLGADRKLAGGSREKQLKRRQ